MQYSLVQQGGIICFINMGLNCTSGPDSVAVSSSIFNGRWWLGELKLLLKHQSPSSQQSKHIVIASSMQLASWVH